MYKTLLTLSCLVLLCLKSSAQCAPPQNVVLFSSSFDMTAGLTWTAPNSTCPILYYEVHYASQPITDPGSPPPGTILSPVNFPGVDMPYGVADAWVRSVCDCEPADGGDGIGDVSSTWIQATFCEQVVIFPDEGLNCPGSPIGIAEVSQCPSYTSAYMDFIALFEWDAGMTLDCTGENEYVLWRNFDAPSDGQVQVSITDDFGWDDFGFVIRSGCSGSSIHCEAQVAGGEEILVTGLSPGETYSIGVWNNDYPYYYEWLDGPCGGYSYNGTSNRLKLCRADVQCAPPFGITTSNITDHTAEISWQSNGSTTWTIEYGPDGFEPGTGTVIEDVTEIPLVLTDLLAETTYSYYVMADCGPDGTSSQEGPYSFDTEPSMWITNTPSDGTGFCCEDYQLPESFGVGAFCDSVYFSYEEQITGSGCEYEIQRLITAQDTCGNSISHTYTFTVTDNDIPCGCEGGRFFDNTNVKAVAIHGDWAIGGKSGDSYIYHRVDDEWEIHDTINLGWVWTDALDMYEDRFIDENKVYRLNGMDWEFETALTNSMNDTAYFNAAIHGTTIVLGSTQDHVAIFEYQDEQWVEVALFAQASSSIDVDEDLVIIGQYSGENTGVVYRKVGGIWQLDGYLPDVPGSYGQGIGSDVAIDGDRAAVGSWYLGGLFTYYHDGTSWTDAQFHENPYWVESFGYNTCFGSAVDIEGDMMVVGDYMNKTAGNFSGSVVVYSWGGEDWVPQANIVPVGHEPNHRFGGCLDLEGDQLTVGIERTYWIGSGGYGGQGRHWFFDCMSDFLDTYTVTAPPGTELSCDEELPLPNYQLGTGWGFDFMVDVDVTGEQVCGDTLVRTITVTDTSGHVASVVQHYPIYDNIPPGLFVQKDLTLDCSIPIPPPVYEASDNCGEATVTITESFEEGCGTTGVLTREFLAIDECGNETIDSQTITLTDTTLPFISCPEDQTVDSDAQGVYAVQSYFGTVDFSDDCSLPVQYVQTPSAGTILGTGQHTIQATVTDLCGNSNDCSFQLTVLPPSDIEELNEDYLHVYPNPADDVLILESQLDVPVLFEVLDMEGRILIKGASAASQGRIDVGSLAEGIYLLRYSTGSAEHPHSIRFTVLH